MQQRSRRIDQTLQPALPGESAVAQVYLSDRSKEGSAEIGLHRAPASRGALLFSSVNSSSLGLTLTEIQSGGKSLARARRNRRPATRRRTLCGAGLCVNSDRWHLLRKLAAAVACTFSRCSAQALRVSRPTRPALPPELLYT